MTQNRTTEICDRAAFKKNEPATTTRKFTIDGSAYKLALCEEHARLFDRELMAWIRLAQDDPYPAKIKPIDASTMFDDDTRERDRHAAELRTRQAVPVPTVLDYGDRPAVEPTSEIDLKGWVLTPHAIERAKQRGYTLQELVDAATRPEIVEPVPEHLVRKYGREAQYRMRGQCMVVVVAERQVVITVLHRDHSRYQAELAQRHNPGRIA